MEIRQKITYQFMAIVAIILLISLLVIYLLFSGQRKEGFDERLSGKAKSIAQLIAETENYGSGLLKRIEKNNPTSLPQELIIAYSLNGRILYQSDTTKSTLHTLKWIKQLKKKKALFLKHQDRDVFGYYYEGEKEKVLVFCSAIDVFGLRKLKNLRLILALVFFLSLIVVYFSGRIFSTKALAPIADVVEQVNAIDINNINSRVKAGSGKDEIARLAGNFNEMLERLEQAFTSQKDFIANASHELRTPLTSITGQLEVTLIKERTSEEYKIAFVSALEEIKNLTTLTNRLLLLSKVTSFISDDTFEQVRIDDILWKARAETLKSNRSYAVTISFDDSIEGEHHFCINGNDQLLKTAFANLIKNGCKYSSNKKSEIQLSVKKNSIQLVFKDNGIGIPEAELENVFQPFYRGSNVKKQRGHGIGLSLVEKIIHLHNGDIHVKSKIKKGTEFIVLLPFS